MTGNPQSSLIISRIPMTRRQVLRSLVTASAGVLAGGAVLTACGNQDSSNASVTLKTTAWPFNAMPSKAEQDKDPNLKAYAVVLEKWLDKNPGVKISKVNTNIWDSKELATSLNTGTAPAAFNGTTLGNYNAAATHAAWAQGLAADVTSLLQEYDVEPKLPKYAQEAWKPESLDGKRFGIPCSYNSGVGIFYRRDLLEAAGLQEPTPEWTWSDLRTLAKNLTKDKVRGIVMQSYGAGTLLNSSGFEPMTRLPAPDKPWHYQIDTQSQSADWQKYIEVYRKMMFEDKSVLSDNNYNDSEVAKAFARGDVAMTVLHNGFYTHPVTSPEALQAIANTVGKSPDEVIGFVSTPRGDNGAPSATQPFIGWVSFDPRLTKTALAKAFDLVHYLFWGDGFKEQRVELYKANQDPKLMYTDPTPYNGITTIEGVPGSVAEAWGQHYVDAALKMANLPLIPNTAFYFPAEENTGPTQDAYSDLVNRLGFSQENINEVLKRYQDVTNQQYSSITSSVSKEEFISAAKTYYKDLDAFYQKNYPKFYPTFHSVYEKKILPVLK